MSDAYRRVQKVEEPLPTNEVRVRRGQGLGRYLKRAYDLYNGQEGQKTSIVVLKGVSNAVQSVVNLAELIKHRVKGLHQINKISNITIVDEYEPLFEGLHHLKFSRVVTMLQVTLTKTPTAAELTDIGYQAPIDESEVQEYNERERVGGDRRGGARGGRGGARRGGRGGRGGNRGNYRGGRDGAVDGAKPEGTTQGRNEGRNEQRTRGFRGPYRGGNGDQNFEQEGGNRNQRSRGQKNFDGEYRGQKNFDGEYRGQKNYDGQERGPKNYDSEKPSGGYYQGNNGQNDRGVGRGNRGAPRTFNNNQDRPRRGGAQGGYNNQEYNKPTTSGAEGGYINEGGAGSRGRGQRPANRGPRGGAPRGTDANGARQVTNA